MKETGQRQAAAVFADCYRDYLIRVGADERTVWQTPDTYLPNLYNILADYSDVVEPIYEMLRRNQAADAGERHIFQHNFTARAKALEQTADADGGSIARFFENNFFNGIDESAGDDMLTWREVEILAATSFTFARTLAIDRENSVVPQRLFRIYLGVMNQARGDTTVTDPYLPVSQKQASWLRQVFELFGRCYSLPTSA